MKKKETYSISDNVTVDIFDFLWNVLGQWKAILIVAIVFSMIAVGMKYRTDMKSYANAGVQTVTVESLEDSMSKQEIDGVDYAVRQYRLIEKYENYIDNSALVDVDPTQAQVAHLEYRIACGDNTTTATVQDAYLGLFQSESFLQGLGELMPRESSRPFAGDLVLVGANGDGASEDTALLVVSVIVLPDMDGAKVLSYVQEQVTSYEKDLQETLGDVSLQPVIADERTLTDAEMMDSQSATIDSAFKLRNSQQQIREGFSEAQTSLYNLRIQELETGGEEVSLTVEPERPRLSKKVLVLGFVVGVLLYVFVYLVLSLFKNKIKTAKECEDTLDIRTLGELHTFHSNGWRRIFVSKFFYRMKYHAYADIELQKNKIVDSMTAYVAKHPDAKMQFTSVAPLREREEAHIRDMIATLKKRGIEVDLYVGDIRKDSSFHQNIAKANQMILVLCKERSVYPDIDLCLELARESEIDIVGNIFVDC